MTDNDFESLLNQYSTPPGREKPDNVEIEWIKDNPNVGLLHIKKHDLTQEDVEDVIFGIHPEVETRKQNRTHPGRIAFWGPTRWKKWIFVSCEEIFEDDIRIL
ncbi:MAG: hypothetical protein HQK54_08365 [Oligoflexales bacterium]|nr:hypothetical protein [Oligoflexales bacterium]